MDAVQFGRKLQQLPEAQMHGKYLVVSYLLMQDLHRLQFLVWIIIIRVCCQRTTNSQHPGDL